MKIDSSIKKMYYNIYMFYRNRYINIYVHFYIDNDNLYNIYIYIF